MSIVDPTIPRDGALHKKSKYHPRQWVDCSDLFYFEGSSGCVCKSHQRKLVDGSDPFYFDLATQMLAQDSFVAPIRNDLNNPPTAVGGIHEGPYYSL
jgi:hypothetical protein